MRNSLTKRQFKVNQNLTITVESKEKDPGLFRHKLTLVVEVANNQPEAWLTKEDIETTLEKLSLEEDQTSLFDGVRHEN